MNPFGDNLINGAEEDGMLAVVIDGQEVPMTALSPAAVGRIQRAHGISIWLLLSTSLINAPMDALETIVDEVAAKLGKPSPAPFDDIDTLIRMFIKTKDDVPRPAPAEGSEVDPTDGGSTAG